MSNNSTPDQMTTLSSRIAKAKEDGYTADFQVKSAGLCTTDKCYGSGEVIMENFYRFEGQSDPDDSSILYVLRTNDGVKGTLSDAYGIYADPKITAFMQEVEERKNNKPNKS